MEKRMSWAGIFKKQVHLITHMENMHFCKPRLEYYQEICNKLMENPEDCLMVGDDPVNDMISGKIGMKTFLITDSSRFKNPLTIFSKRLGFGKTKDRIKPDYSGPLVQLQKILPIFV